MIIWNSGRWNIYKFEYIPIASCKTIKVISVLFVEAIPNPPVWKIAAILIGAYHGPSHMGNSDNISQYLFQIISMKNSGNIGLSLSQTLPNGKQ